MADTVLFSLYGALGAFGGPAGYTRRSTEMQPSRSNLIGLCAAALGIPRTDQTQLAALSVWKFACAPIAPERQHQRIIRDYHTAQTVHRKVKRPRSRRDAIKQGSAAGAIHTEITQRDYLTDCAFAVAAWGGDAKALATALRHPIFAPYLGRKSCPLAAPMNPMITDTNAPWAAFGELSSPPWFGPGRIDRFTCDAVQLPTGDCRITSTSHAYDDPGDRGTWSFHRRRVEMRRLDPAIIVPVAEEPGVAA